MVKKRSVAPGAAQSTAKTTVVPRVTPDAIGRHAYELFQARGYEHGYDVEDWLVAEAELLGGYTEIGVRD